MNKSQIEIWAQSLPTLEISEEEAKSIAQGRREIEAGEYSILSIEDLVDEASQD